MKGSIDHRCKQGYIKYLCNYFILLLRVNTTEQFVSRDLFLIYCRYTCVKIVCGLLSSFFFVAICIYIPFLKIWTLIPSPKISTELVIHTHVPLYFHLLSPCVKCYCLKTNEKATTHCTNGLKKKSFLFFVLKSKRSVVEV